MKPFSFSLVVAVAGFGLGAPALPVAAQPSPALWAPVLQSGEVDGRKIDYVRFDRTPTSEALRTVLLRAGVKHEVSSNLEGTVTLEASNVELGVLLAKLLPQASAWCVVVDGTYYVRPIEEAIPPEWARSNPKTRAMSLDMRNVDVREALRWLFQQRELDYSIAPEVQGTVSLRLSNAPFETVLRSVLRQVKADWRIEADIYQVIHKRVTERH
jgi:type II secretory pathway component GspD/PulD (secretin)